jgi:uncharacterized protein
MKTRNIEAGQGSQQRSSADDPWPERGNARRRTGRRWIFWSMLGLFAAMAGLFLLMRLPEHILFGYRLHFSILELDRDRELLRFDHRTADGLTLRSWYVPPRDGRPTIVYFAGRDGDILYKPGHLVGPVEEGYGLLLVGYRGYGGNPGFPSEVWIQRDNLALLDRAREAGITPNGTILYGYSMGSAFAAHAAAYSEPLGVVLEAPLSTFLAAVRLQAGRVPGFLVRTRLDNLARLPMIDAPILLLAGGMDTITPPSFAHALAYANPGLTKVEIVPEANHFNIIRLGGYRAIEEFLQDIEAAEQVETRFAARAGGWLLASARNSTR